ncbi:TIGR02391 family protein [bacterium (Candidatus Blackallbacteria) CG17_big_fil_post_rev_8_21_14_2_50_48_46]|uniref:TIGR02391 family protein n=1 Tax=bacterium (Candidatus Blackallbacteria) CG17_big_fil_post_rev_8_21_14_2_50_48_46 TaxID=2014261 RepID=A0A2M7G5Y5_9BACT|nr:MAG: TIGR02391 family protein [bacterium (Candidatus Blackallbacteria) CG18_big_fil_WC_8_21_14_2_50_49_26]PIW17275.1 MAG: TIGR02391 family protein [bacterium (Candidatus Blackallbacteria) CG17_big_fil_post_rev_8_21_14_2_50_48_46]
MSSYQRLLSDLEEWKHRLARVTMANHMIERLGFFEFVTETPILKEIIDELPHYEVPHDQMYTDAFARPIWPDNCSNVKGQTGYLWAGITGIVDASDIQDAGRYIDRSANVPGSISAFYDYLYPPVIQYLRKRLKDKLEEQQVSNPPFVPRVLSQVEQQEITRQYLHSLTFLHPEVLSVSGDLIKDGHYRSAILDAYIHLIQNVKEKSGITDRDGVPLIQQAFGTMTPSLRISNNQDEQDGARNLFVGGVMMFRNMPAHFITDHSDPHKAIEILTFASLLFRLLDQA